MLRTQRAKPRQQRHDRLPTGTAPTDPQAVSLNRQLQTTQDTISRCRSQVEAANSYLRARPYAQGHENAPFGLKFTEPGATPEFKKAVEQAVTNWEETNGVDVEVRRA